MENLKKISNHMIIAAVATLVHFIIKVTVMNMTNPLTYNMDILTTATYLLINLFIIYHLIIATKYATKDINEEKEEELKLIKEAERQRDDFCEANELDKENVQIEFDPPYKYRMKSVRIFFIAIIILTIINIISFTII